MLVWVWRHWGSVGRQDQFKHFTHFISLFWELNPTFKQILRKKIFFIVLITNNGHLVRWLQTKKYTDISIDRIRGSELENILYVDFFFKFTFTLRGGGE